MEYFNVELVDVITFDNLGGTLKMTYTPAYNKSDFQNIVVDGLGTAGAAFVSWVDLIVLLIVLGFIVGIFIKLGNLFR
jgi:hypothetical protein